MNFCFFKWVPGFGVLGAMSSRHVTWIFGLIFALSLGCSSTPARYRLDSHDERTEISEMVISTMRFRRPPGEGADPRVSPGGADYRGVKTEGNAFDCQEPEKIFAKINFQKLTECLQSIEATLEVEYRLQLSAEPLWQLSESETVPTCLKQELAQIPVPREIVFQSRVRDPNHELEPVDCYVSRLEIERGLVLDVRLPLVGKKKLLVRLPIEITKDDQLKRLLESWSLSVFWSDGKVQGKLLASQLCQRCQSTSPLIIEKDYASQAKWLGSGRVP